MLHLTVSNRLEALADALAERIEAAPLSDPFADERIVVPHSGVGRWLQLRLAQRWGAAAMLRFELPAQLIGGLLAQQEIDSDPAAWGRSALRWRLLEWLTTMGSGSATAAFAPLKHYLRARPGALPDPLKPWQLASALADLMDAYQVYRPDWLQSWSRQQRVLPLQSDEVWQSALWRTLQSALGATDRATRMQAMIERWQSGDTEAAALPVRISLFGALPLIPSTLDFLRVMGRTTEVAAYHCAPSADYWTDLRSARERSRQRARNQSNEVDVDVDQPLSPTTELLTSLGKRAREAQGLQIDHWLDEAVESERWIEPDSTHLLGWLQRSMLSFEPLLPPVEALPTLRVHACANPRREVEALLDVLLDLIERDPTLRPHEIAIMAPSLDRYASIIDAVMAATPIERRLPLTFADRQAAGLHPMIARYLWLLRLPQARFTRSEVLGLLDVAEVRARFGLSAEGYEWLQTWARELGVARGLNAQQREQSGEGGSDAHGWAAALERLLMGQAAGDDGGLIDGIAPFDTGDDESAALALGALWQLLRRLDRWRLRLGESLSPAQSCEALRRLLSGFFLVDQTDAAAADAESAILDAIAGFERAVELAEANHEVGFEPMTAALEEALSEPARWQQFLGEGVTVCALVPLRSVPFRVIAVLGLDDQRFPRRVVPVSFDLMTRASRAGDRQPRDEDRQLLLDTVLAAREHLHLSYVGVDEKGGDDRPPAAPLAEIIESLRSAYGTQWTTMASRCVVRHPMASYDVGNFRHSALGSAAASGSFAAQWWPATQATLAEPLPASPLVDRPLPTDRFESPIDVDRLLRFFHHPARAFLRESLLLSSAPWIERGGDDEPMEMAYWEQHNVLGALIAARVESGSIASKLRRLKAEGLLPQGVQGDQLLARLAAQIDSLASEHWDALAPVSLDASVELGPLQLSGALGCLRDAFGPVAMTSALPEPIELMRLLLARELMARDPASTAGHGGEPVAVVTVFDKNKPTTRKVLAPLVDVDAWFADLAQGWREGHATPLPLPRKSGWAAAKALAAGKSDADAIEAARKIWFGSPGASAERDDADLRLAFRDRSPLEDRGFLRACRRFYVPLAAAWTDAMPA